MKYIAIFEDKKGFTKVLEFAQLPHDYNFVEYTEAQFMPSERVPMQTSKDTIIKFTPYGKKQEVYGQIVQKYKQV